ncbi:MAG: hypothetical protein K2X49_09685 [Acetobacteraceae bacterium]|nr:hypothetical protein [Acetobacteraceae bacterium]
MSIPRRGAHALPLAAATAPAPGAAAGPLDAVEARHARIGDLPLQSGTLLPDVTLCFETYGTLNAAGDNAVLPTRGFTGSQHMAGRHAPGGAPPGVAETRPGSWSLMVGPGRPIDPARVFEIRNDRGHLGANAGSPDWVPTLAAVFERAAQS